MELYLSPNEVCRLVPGMTVNLLAQMRFRGDGPEFIRASPRKIVYSRTEIDRYLESRRRSSTAGIELAS